MSEFTIDFLVSRSDLRETRIERGPTPDGVVVAPGQALLAIDRFAFTANNVTYAAFGEGMGYWKFFPARAPWGRVPVWGFANVARSRCDGIAPGERVYGYFPMSSHLVVQPERVTAGSFGDASAHRSALPPVYNQYSRIQYSRILAGPLELAGEDATMLFRPLFLTAFLIDDLLGDEVCFGARTAVIASASSKTALALAFLLSRRSESRCEVIGLTSSAHRAFVESTACYDRVLSYGETDALDVEPSVFIDMAGDGRVLAAVHRRLGEALRYSAIVGATHWDAPRPPADLPGPKPAFFFAPDRARERVADWGAAGLDARVAAAWQPFAAAAARWIKVEHHFGPDAVRAAYLAVLEGRAEPDRGLALSLRTAASARGSAAGG